MFKKAIKPSNNAAEMVEDNWTILWSSFEKPEICKQKSDFLHNSPKILKEFAYLCRENRFWTSVTEKKTSLVCESSWDSVFTAGTIEVTSFYVLV